MQQTPNWTRELLQQWTQVPVVEENDDHNPLEPPVTNRRVLTRGNEDRPLTDFDSHKVYSQRSATELQDYGGSTGREGLEELSGSEDEELDWGEPWKARSPEVPPTPEHDPDMIILRSRNREYRLYFAPYAISDGRVLVGDLRRCAAEEVNADPWRIRLTYKQRLLDDDCKQVALYYIKQHSTVLFEYDSDQGNEMYQATVDGMSSVGIPDQITSSRRSGRFYDQESSTRQVNRRPDSGVGVAPPGMSSAGNHGWTEDFANKGDEDVEEIPPETRKDKDAKSYSSS